LALIAAAACQASTTRPTFGPLPGAASGEVHLGPEEATRILAAALASDSIPLHFVHEGDGVIVSEWLDVPGYQKSNGRGLGPGTVRVRAWVDRGVINQADTSSVYTVETAYRVYADPAREGRELEQPVAETHPARLKIARLLERLVRTHGDAPATASDSLLRTPAPPPPPAAGAGHEARGSS
jgi:hypothetical protein